MRNTLLLLAAALFAICSCEEDGQKAEPLMQETVVPQDTTALVVMQVQRCSRLYTTEWHIHKIVTHDDDLRLRGQLLGQKIDVPMPAGDRKIAIPIDVTVKGWVDLGQFSDESVERRGERITLYLPDPEVTVTSSKVDWRQVKSYVSLTRSRFSDEEMASYAKQGRKAVVDNLSQLGIEKAAQESAARILVPMLVSLGYAEENITVTFRKDMRLTIIRNDE